jgi:hypothetical protein
VRLGDQEVRQSKSSKERVYALIPGNPPKWVFCGVARSEMALTQRELQRRTIMINRKTLRTTALYTCAIVALFSSAIPQGRAHAPLHPHDFIAADSQDSSAQERMARPSCSGNLIRNGDFTTGVNVVGDGSMPASAVANWTSASGSPQVTNAMGCGSTGFISMWGNKVVGEAIQQTGVPIVSGKAYTFSACVRWVSKPGLPNYVYFRVSASSGPVPSYGGGTLIGLTPGIISPNWTTVTLPVWVAGNYNTITINPENNSSVNDGAQVSWGQIDNVCIQEVPKCLTVKPGTGCCIGNNKNGLMYTFSYMVNNPFPYPCNVTVTSANGNVIAYGPTSAPPGNSIIAVTFVDVAPVNNPFCLIFQCAGQGGACESKVCSDLRPCP